MEYSEGFSRWWECYPSYRKKGKGGAFKIWKRDGLEKRKDELIAKLQEQVDFDEQFSGKYVPMPTTYLNQNRYDDPTHKKTRPTARATEPREEGPREECWFTAKIKSVAFRWMWNRGGVPDHMVPHISKLVRVLGSRLKDKAEGASEDELKKLGEVTPDFVRKELESLMADPPVRVDELETLVGR